MRISVGTTNLKVSSTDKYLKFGYEVIGIERVCLIIRIKLSVAAFISVGSLTFIIVWSFPLQSFVLECISRRYIKQLAVYRGQI